MFKLFAMITTSFVAATPEEGCYYGAVTQSIIELKVIVNVTSASTLNMDVYWFDPRVRQYQIAHGDLHYKWNSTTSVIQVDTMKRPDRSIFGDYTPGFSATFPLDLTYHESGHALSTVIGVPMVLLKRPSCDASVLFRPDITTVAPTDMLAASVSETTPKVAMTTFSFVSWLIILAAVATL